MNTLHLTAGRRWNVSAAIALGKHPVPSRTRKLSPSAPMVLHGRPCGRVGRRRTPREKRATPPGWPSFFMPFSLPVFLCPKPSLPGLANRKTSRETKGAASWEAAPFSSSPGPGTGASINPAVMRSGGRSCVMSVRGSARTAAAWPPLELLDGVRRGNGDLAQEARRRPGGG
jgi:hypothetical protein